MENYIVIASYVDITAEDCFPEITDHCTKVLGRANNLDEMYALAQAAFDQVIQDDYEFLKMFKKHQGELPEHHKEGFKITFNSKEDLNFLLTMWDSEGIDQGGELEEPPVIGSLYSHNKKYNYALHMIVSAIKEEGGN